MKTFHYTVRGRVQGVFFRFHTKDTADRLAIKGTVKNLSTGEVEVYAQGNPEALEEFENFLSNGPSLSSVEQVSKEETEAGIVYPDFKIIH